MNQAWQKDWRIMSERMSGSEPVVLTWLWYSDTREGPLIKESFHQARDRATNPGSWGR